MASILLARFGASLVSLELCLLYPRIQPCCATEWVLVSRSALEPCYLHAVEFHVRLGLEPGHCASLLRLHLDLCDVALWG